MCEGGLDSVVISMIRSIARYILLLIELIYMYHERFAMRI